MEGDPEVRGQGHQRELAEGTEGSMARVGGEPGEPECSLQHHPVWKAKQNS